MSGIGTDIEIVVVSAILLGVLAIAGLAILFGVIQVREDDHPRWLAYLLIGFGVGLIALLGLMIWHAAQQPGFY